MTTARDRCLAAATELVDALLAAMPPVVESLPDPVDDPIDVPVVIAGVHPMVMLATQAVRLKAAMAAGTPAFTRWRSSVDSWLRGDDPWGFGADDGALLAALTGDSRYAVKAIAVIDQQVIDAETAYGKGLQPEVAGDSYLHVGELIGDLALVYDWCFGLVSSAQRSRWIAYANQAVYNVWNNTKAAWGGRPFPWTGWGTDDPGNNYYYSFTRATMLWGLASKGENPQSQAWLDKFRERIVGRLIPAFTRDVPDGGSREGTGYGVALRSLFELYAYWQWSTGERLADLTTHTRETISTVLHQVLPGAAWRLPVGDQSRDSTAALFDYDRHELDALVALYPTAKESACAAAMLAGSTVPAMSNAFMRIDDFVFPAPAPAAVIDLPLVRYAKGIGEVYARTSWRPEATLLWEKAGPLTQSHAHEDQGSLMLWRDGWLVADPVIWSKGGVRQATSPVGTTAAHSQVRVDLDGKPVSQRDNPAAGKLLAFRVGPGYLFTSADLTAAYGGNAAVTMVRRQILWLQPDTVMIHDHVVTSPLTTQCLQFVVPTLPAIMGAAAVVTAGKHSLRVARIAPSSGPWTAFRFDSDPDFTGGFRLDQKQPGGDCTYVTALLIDQATVVPAVTWADVGCSFSLAGKTFTLTAGIDVL